MNKQKEFGQSSKMLDVVRKIMRQEEPSDTDHEELKQQLDQLSQTVKQLNADANGAYDLWESHLALFGPDPILEDIYQNYFGRMLCEIDVLMNGRPDDYEDDSDDGLGLIRRLPHYEHLGNLGSLAKPIVEPSVKDLQELVKKSLQQLIFGLGAHGYRPTPELVRKLIRSKFPRLLILIESYVPIPGGQEQKLYKNFEAALSSIFHHTKAWKYSSGISKDPLDELQRAIEQGKENGWACFILSQQHFLWNTNKRPKDPVSQFMDPKFTAFADEPDWVSKWTESTDVLSKEVDMLKAKNFSDERKATLEAVLLELIAAGHPSFFDDAEILGEKRAAQCIRVGLTSDVIDHIEDSDPSDLRMNWIGLGLSVFFGRRDLASLFLDRGAFEDADDESALLGKLLLVAVSRNHIDVARLLLDRGASTAVIEFDLGDEWGSKNSKESLLVHAISNSSFDMIDLLLEKAPDLLDIVGQKGTPLFAAAEYKSPKVLAALIEHGADVMAVNHHGETLLHKARYASVALFLIQSGLDPNATDSLGRSPLNASPIASVARVLLRSGANVNVQDNDGLTPLHDAVINKAEPWIDLIKSLIDAGVDFNAQDKFGRTPLHYIAEYGNHNGQEYFDWDHADLLIEAGANVNVQDNDGLTPLHHAASHRGLETHYGVDYLLKKGADIAVTTADGKTAEDLLERDLKGDKWGEVRKAYQRLVEHPKSTQELQKGGGQND